MIGLVRAECFFLQSMNTRSRNVEFPSHSMDHRSRSTVARSPVFKAGLSFRLAEWDSGTRVASVGTISNKQPGGHSGNNRLPTRPKAQQSRQRLMAVQDQ